MTKIAVNGALGRMGRRILSLALESKEIEIVGAFETKGNEEIGRDLSALGLGPMKVKLSILNEKTLKNADVLVDFSSPEGLGESLKAALKTKTNLVIGTTGLDDKIQTAVRTASKDIAIVLSSNMSVGVTLVLELLAIAAAKLPKDFDIEITEAHHRHKKDAPSGTALMLASAIAKAKGWDLKKALKYRTEGKTSVERSEEEIGMQVIRAGEIVGDHTVLFGGPSETIEITHRAQSRDTFARGALMAACYLGKKKSGLFGMSDVLK